MKKLFLIPMVAALLLAGQQAFAYEFEVDGIYYNKLVHEDPNGGCGETTLSVQNADHDGTYSGDVVIPETVEFDGQIFRVTSIGIKAFNNCPDLTSVSLPYNINVINYMAFGNCPQLKEIVLPETMTLMDEYAFYGCHQLQFIYISNTMPFTIEPASFGGINTSYQIVVPCDCLPAFDSDTLWRILPLIDDCGNIGIVENEPAVLDVYPNPSNGQVNLNLGEGRWDIEVYDLTGRVVYRGRHENQSLLDLGQCPKGLYFLKATNEGHEVTAKLTIQ